MSTNQRNAELKRIEMLTRNRKHIRTAALQLAGLLLQGAKDDALAYQLDQIDDEIEEDEELYAAYETLIESIAREVVLIGKELSAQAKQT